MTTIALSTVALIALVFAQGFLLQVAVALTGDPAPGYGRAMRLVVVASILAAIGGTAWMFTFGWLFGGYLTEGLGGMVFVAIASLVYRRSLNVSMLQAFLVALIQSVLSVVLTSVAYYLIGHL